MQYLLQELALKTQSRKRTKSWANLLEGNSSSKQLSRGGDPRSKQTLTQFYSSIRGDGDDADSLENNPDGSGHNLSPNTSSRKLKPHRLSKTLMFQSSSGFDKVGILTIDEPINEAIEEDDMTQMSEKKAYECDKDQLAKVIN